MIYVYIYRFLDLVIFLQEFIELIIDIYSLYTISISKSYTQINTFLYN